MGSGKSTVGKLLAKKLSRPFIDLDEVIENREMRSIPSLFEQEGERYFREQETLALMAIIASLDSFVLATGGGIVLKKMNRDIMAKSGKIIHLSVSVQEVLHRLEGDSTRPLLQGSDKKERIRKLMAKRATAYADRSRSVPTTGRTPGKIVDAIMKIPGLR